MTMQRRHFELIAETLRAALEAEGAQRNVRTPRHALNALAYDFADALAATNPNFNRARFLRACGVDDN